MNDLQSIRNIGPQMAAQLQKAGLNDATTVRALGLDECYRRLLAAGMAPHFMAYLALDAGLKNQHFNFHCAEEKAALRSRHDSLLSVQRKSPDKAIEAFLNQIGIRD